MLTTCPRDKEEVFFIFLNLIIRSSFPNSPVNLHVLLEISISFVGHFTLSDRLALLYRIYIRTENTAGLLNSGHLFLVIRFKKHEEATHLSNCYLYPIRVLFFLRAKSSFYRFFFF